MAFPTSLDTFHTCVNNLTFSLTADYVAADPTIYSNATTGAPTAGSFHLGSNIIYYTGKTTNSFTGCTGGNDGTADVDQLMLDGGNEIVFGPEAHNVNDLNTAAGSLESKVGIDGSAVTTSHDYKLSGVTGTDKAASKTGTETLTNKTLTSPVITNKSSTGTDSGTETLTSKRITRREITIASHATPTPTSDTADIYTITAQTAAAAFAVPSGTPTQGQTLLIRIKDNGTARALSWNAIYRAGTDVALPTTTVLSKTLYVGLIYNLTDTKWDLIFVDDGF